MRRRFRCLPCVGGEHGEQCFGHAHNCACRCRAMLGLDGPFEFGDPTVPSGYDPIDKTDLVEVAG